MSYLNLPSRCSSDIIHHRTLLWKLVIFSHKSLILISLLERILDENGVSWPEIGVNLQLSQHPLNVATNVIRDGPDGNTSPFAGSNKELAIGAETKGWDVKKGADFCSYQTSADLIDDDSGAGAFQNRAVALDGPFLAGVQVRLTWVGLDWDGYVKAWGVDAEAKGVGHDGDFASELPGFYSENVVETLVGCQNDVVLRGMDVKSCDYAIDFIGALIRFCLILSIKTL